MNLNEEQVNELKSIAPSLSIAEEGGYIFILIERFKLPDSCIPNVSDLLLCPQLREGYQSRIYFPVKVECKKNLNWNGQVSILDRNWYSYSWKTEPGLTLAQMLMIHLTPLKQK